MRQLSWILWVATGVVFVLVLWWASLQLPQHMATHFGPSGEADGWGSRTAFVWVMGALGLGVHLGLMGLVSALLRGSGFGVNITDADWWFATEERKALLRPKFMADMALFLAATTALMTYVVVDVVRANRSAAPATGAGFWLVFGLYMVFVIGFTVRMMRSYRKPEGADD